MFKSAVYKQGSLWLRRAANMKSALCYRCGGLLRKVWNGLNGVISVQPAWHVVSLMFTDADDVEAKIMFGVIDVYVTSGWAAFIM